MVWLFIGFYTFLLGFVLVYSMMQLHTTYLYLQHKNRRPTKKPVLPSLLPLVTIQLPIYNERYVVERLLKSVSELQYPTSLLEIQVLDDSTDQTSTMVKTQLQSLQSRGFNLQHIQRKNRTEFKAGALANGLKTAKGEFIAIFDADFLPKKDFLLRTIPYFSSDDIGVVQTRWGHLNENYSLLTLLQSYALNAHFSIEQAGRNSKGHFINFNGTAGVWRKKTIEDAGGWQGDTLTEDLDLSYRAQLKGWQFIYLEEVETPAELPVEMNALKSQQFRWAKGAAECTGKNLKKVFESSSIKMATKLHSFFHLLNSFNWVCLFVSALLLLPFQALIEHNKDLESALGFLFVFHITFFALFLYYFVANIYHKKQNWKSILTFCMAYPAFLTLSMGISLYNTIGVLEGYLGKKSAFVRTPKFNRTWSNQASKTNAYVQFKINYVTVLEIIALAYFSYTTYITWQLGNYVAFPFVLMMTLGIATVLLLSSVHFYQSRST